ncbi:hypothetical protein HOLleu_35558 [Holothuria leucospilota]|uniref:Integrase catalytic domain-containing protein n=1 Tax=Holothuria leucospilota TaxID=206669 RepID=A0A9Q0YQ56_HOLLE|nr:hypothetical protein HOLleu_35558 [Holothuria leucospilota]
MLRRIHTGHLGIEKCKKRAREVIYWPRIDQDIKNLVEVCSTCLTYRSKQQQEPLEPHSDIEQPWVKVGIDLFTLKGINYLIVTDYFSSYPEFVSMLNTTRRAVIDKIKTIFARHGIPEEVFSDNGPQFTSREFRQFSEEWEFKHTTSSPLYPQSNGLLERSIQTVKTGVCNLRPAGQMRPATSSCAAREPISICLIFGPCTSCYLTTN